jgi:hypothetical protein
MKRTDDQYEADNYTLSYHWDAGNLEIKKTWRSSGYVALTQLGKSEVYALRSFIEGNLTSSAESTIDDWVDLV